MAIVLLVALLIMLTKFPALRVIITVTPNKDRSPHRFLACAYSPLALGSISAILLRWRTTACWSYLIRYAVEEIPGMTAALPLTI